MDEERNKGRYFCWRLSHSTLLWMIFQNRVRFRFCSIHYVHLLRCPDHFFRLQRQLRQAKLLVAARLSDYLIIDCSFSHEYNQNESTLRNYYDRLQLKIHSCFTSIYRYHSPSFVLLCNLSANEKNQSLRNSPFCHATSVSYLDLFPREQLIYLSPDSPNIMTEYEHNSIYILGGIFEKSRLKHPKRKFFSLLSSKNRTVNLRKGEAWTDSTSIFATAEIFKVKSIYSIQAISNAQSRFSSNASAVLSLNQVYNILMTLKHTNNNWSDALHCIPERCLSR